MLRLIFKLAALPVSRVAAVIRAVTVETVTVEAVTVEAVTVEIVRIVVICVPEGPAVKMMLLCPKLHFIRIELRNK